MDALVEQKLSEVEHRRFVGLEPAAEAFLVPLVWEPLARVSGIGRIEPALREQRLERSPRLFRPELGDIDPRRHLVYPVDVAEDVLEYLPNVRRPDEDRLRRRKGITRPGRELGIAADRVFELRSVSLDRERSAGCGC